MSQPTQSFLDVLFPGESPPPKDHSFWKVLDSREFRIMINFLILNKLSGLIEKESSDSSDDLVELKTYAKILHSPKAMKEFFFKQEVQPNESSDIENF